MWNRRPEWAHCLSTSTPAGGAGPATAQRPPMAQRPTVAFAHLGCEKNRVDTEHMLGLLAHVQTVLQHRFEQRRALDLQADLFVAARRAHDDRRAGTDTGVDRIIGGDVAGMQGDHHVQLARRHAAHVAALEHQPRMIQLRCGGVAQVDHFFTQLDAGDFAFGLEGIAQVVVDREGQVALAGAEVDGMQRLVEDTLQLAWLDTERTPLPDEAIQVQALWEMLTDNACYESGWPSLQLQCAVPSSCWVRGNLNTLAQALENILRNAIRHSPTDGIVCLDGRREGDFWHLWLEDEGGGVDARHARPPGITRWCAWCT